MTAVTSGIVIRHSGGKSVLERTEKEVKAQEPRHHWVQLTAGAIAQRQPTGLKTLVWPSWIETITGPSTTFGAGAIFTCSHSSNIGTKNWLPDALAAAARVSEGTDRSYAEIALRHASSCTEAPPSISKAPAGGVVIEHRHGDRFVTLIIESKLGVLVGSSSDTQANTTFDINMNSINELLDRYAFELTQSQLA